MTKKGYKPTDEHRRKNSEAKKGDKNPAKTPESRRKNSESHKGKKLSKETKIKISVALTGRILTDEWKRKIGDSRIGKKNPMKHPEVADFRKGKTFEELYGEEKAKEIKGSMSKTRMGKRHSEETKQKMVYSHKGEKSYLWKGGISFLPYCEKFDEDLKERVREFFGRCCYVCGKTEQEQIDEMIARGKRPIKKLDVHHVNYQKMACCEEEIKPLFVPLCKSCHTRTNHDREYWKEFFTISLKCLTKGECFVRKYKII